MKNILFYISVLILVLNHNLTNAQTYSYDFNTTTKTARIYTNNEVILDFNVLTENGFGNDLKLENGYIFEFQENEWTNKGFFNKNEIIYNNENYLLKKNFIGNLFIKKETDKKWSQLKLKKNKLTIEYNGNTLPKTVSYLFLHQVVKNICTIELERIREKRIQSRLEYENKLKEKEIVN